MPGTLEGLVEQSVDAISVRDLVIRVGLEPLGLELGEEATALPHRF